MTQMITSTQHVRFASVSAALILTLGGCSAKLNETAGGSSVLESCVAGEDAGADGGCAEAAITISSLTIEPNPDSTIACFVSWTSNVASTSEVQFGLGGLQFRILDDAVTTQHRVLVIGMRAQSTYQIRAVSVSQRGREPPKARSRRVRFLCKSQWQQATWTIRYCPRRVGR